MVSIREMSHLLYMIKMADQKVSRMFEEEMGFSLTRYEMLMVLKEKAPCLQNELQTALKIDQAAITRHLKILEAKGYVVRQRNPKNNREVIVDLTEKVLIELKKCETGRLDLEKALFDSFDEKEMEQLTALLGKFDQNLNKTALKGGMQNEQKTE